MTSAPRLPAGVRVFERGWLSSNNILVTGDDGPSALIDSGYWTHSAQTVDLVRHALADRPLDLLVNTHLHSDHCGGNAALQVHYAGVQTWIPPGQAPQVRNWDPYALSYVPTGQFCPRFRVNQLLEPGSTILLGDLVWEVHAAAGHDPHAVLLFDPHTRTLVSADALWENGFGIVFPELEGASAFDEVARTLDLIDSLNPALVIPGHGAMFTCVADALVCARRKLETYVAAPGRHARHAAKVLLKFKLLEVQSFSWEALHHWAASTDIMNMLRLRWDKEAAPVQWVDSLADDLVRIGAAHLTDGCLVNA